MHILQPYHSFKLFICHIRHIFSKMDTPTSSSILPRAIKETAALPDLKIWRYDSLNYNLFVPNLWMGYSKLMQLSQTVAQSKACTHLIPTAI